MQKRHSIPSCLRIIPILLIAVLVFVPFTRSFSRGSASTVDSVIVDDAAFNGSAISSTTWRYRADEGIKLISRQTGKKAILFGGTTDSGGTLYTAGNPLIARRRAFLDTQTDILTMKFALRLVSLPEGMRFGAVFGISKISGDAGDESSYFLYFKNDGGYSFGLSRFLSGEETDLAAADFPAGVTAGGFKATDFSVSIIAKGTGELIVTVAGKTLFSGVVEAADFTGYTGFSILDDKPSFGRNVNIELTAPLYIYNLYYERPETPLEVKENFDTNDFNTKLWDLMNPWLGATGCYVDGGKLVFDRAYTGSYFISKYKYSNFDLEFSLSDFKNEIIEDTYAFGGRIAATAGLSVAFGHASDKSGLLYGKLIPAHVYWDFYSLGYILKIDADVETSGENKGKRNGITTLTLYEKGVAIGRAELTGGYDFLNATEDKAAKKVYIKVTVEDGVFYAGVRSGEDKTYSKPVLAVGINGGLTPIGQVSFWADGEVSGSSTIGCEYFSSYAVDDITLKNTDSSPNTVDVGERISNKVVSQGDAEYTDRWTDGYLLNGRLEELQKIKKKNKAVGIILGGIGGAAVIAFGTVLLVRAVKKRGGKTQ